MDKTTKISVAIAVVFVLIVPAALVGGFYVLAKTIGIEASLIWSTLIAAVGWMISEHISRRREHQKLLAEQKRELYFKFLDFVLSHVDLTRQNERGEHGNEADDALIKEMTRWSLKLTLVGSDGVVKAWNGFRMGSATRDTTKLFGTVAELLTEMRKDCGHYGTTLTKLELLSVMIKQEDLEKLRDALKD